MSDKPKESDWKTFRKLVPELRERYLRQRNAELNAILHDESLRRILGMATVAGTRTQVAA